MKKILSTFAVLALLAPVIATSAGKIVEVKTGKSIAEKKLPVRPLHSLSANKPICG